MTSCDNNEDKIFKDDGNFESKPTSLLAGGDNAASLDQESETIKKAASARYAIKITSDSGAVLCRGVVDLTIMTNFSIELPEAFITCGGNMNIDLASVLSGGIGGGDSGKGILDGFGDKGGDSPVSHDGKVLSLSEIAGVKFDPPRPLMLGPIINNPDDFKDFERTVSSSATHKSGKTGSGKFKLKVLNHQGKYSNPLMEKSGLDPFKNVMHWEMKTSGFEGFTASEGLIIEKFEWYWNTRPLMIPEIQIEGNLGDLFGNPDGDTLAGDAIGYVKLNLMVEDFKQFD